ncbi:MAG: hypothetical protein SFX73_24105 [Kofleriaceae bacterium]|nr:hypothetical protein [Kofleriaceae bacterium]
MSLGIVEVITLLLGLGGFSVQQNPKAPTPEAALQYAMPDADVVLHFDAASVVPNNYKVLSGLPSSPAIKASPDLANSMRKVIGEVEGARGLAKAATGIDVVNDVNDATMFVQVVPRQDPNFVAVIHGKFTPANLDKIAKMTSKQVTKVGSGAVVDMGANDPAIGVTKDGVLIAGTLNLVRDRVNDTWKAPARPPGSNLAHAADVIAQKPIYAMVVTLSQKARKAANDNMGQKNFLSDMVTRHKLATFSVFSDGIGWTWIDSSKAGLDNMETMSAGALDLLKASHIAPRGFAKLALGAIDSYKGVDKQLDDVIRRKGDVMKIVETYTGDGNFKTSIIKDPKTLKLTVRATGKSLSEVVPAGAVLPLGVLWLTAVRGGPDQMEVVEPTPAPPPRGLSAPAPKKK